MEANDLKYENLKVIIKGFEEKGRTEGRTFLNWFLENIFRLDPIEADDSICDKANDRGIDGIFVDHTQEEVIVFQGKLKQKESSIGDGPLRELAGTLTQVETPDTVQALLDGGGNDDLKNLLLRLRIKALVEKGYAVVGAFVSNQAIDANGQEFADAHNRIRVYDRNRISTEYIELEAEGGVAGEFSFDTTYVAPLVLKTGGGVVSFVLPVQASELVKMSGIDDGTLFAQNVRQSLGNTKVNKAMRASVFEKSQHQYFPLYHNGVTILCKKAQLTDETLTISDYVVVNGAQSITTFKRSEKLLTEDLRVIAKVVELNDPALAKDITINSNNQNAIKPRDLKSTNEVQLRLRKEFEAALGGKFDLEIKRGQNSRDGTVVITNEEAGRLLLAFDLMEPESCHQVYKLFDEKYAEIFARPSVTAYRIVLLNLLMAQIIDAMDGIQYKPLSKYGLTRFFLLSVIAEMLRADEFGVKAISDPKSLLESQDLEGFLEAVSEALKSIVVDLNYEVKERGDQFDYKGDLKSPSKIRELRSELLKSYEKELAKGKMKPIKDALPSA